MAAGKTQILAWITPLMSHATFPKPRPPGEPGKPPGGSTGEPPVVDNTLPGDLPRPAHPIYLPLPPGVPVDPDYGISIERPDQTLPGDLPRPDNTLPGQPPRPSQGPGFPTNPIVLPDDPGGGWLPIYIWGGGNVPMPNPPIELPPDGETDEGFHVEYRYGWTQETGWVGVAVIVPPEGAGIVTPSKKK